MIISKMNDRLLCSTCQVAFIGSLLLSHTVWSQPYDRCRTPRDFVFLIDHSGTMQGNDPDGLRWDGLRTIIRRLAQETDRNDRLVFVPFGSKKDTEKYLTKHEPIRWFKLRDRQERQELFQSLDHWFRDRGYSDSTDIFAPFELLARRFHDTRQRTSDLYIFFISDGRMDVGDPRRGEAHRRRAIRARHQELNALLERYRNLWRVYSICIGRVVSEERHREILSHCRINRRRSGLPYPPLGHTSPGQPYFLRVNQGNSRQNLSLMTDSIWDALDIGGAEIYRGEATLGGVRFPNAEIDDFRFHFSLAHPMRANEFLSKLSLRYRIDDESHAASLVAEYQDADDPGSCYLDYRVNARQLSKTAAKSDLAKVEEWEIEVAPLPRDQAVVSLQIVQRHGWRVFIDSLLIEPSPYARGLRDRWHNRVQPCGANLWMSGWAYNECGGQIIETEQQQLTLEINQGEPHPLKIERERTYNQITNAPSFVYYWKSGDTIARDPAFDGNLGGSVTFDLKLPAFGGYLYRNHSIEVPVCAQYSRQ